MSGHKRVWAQSCLGTNVSGVGSSMYGHNRVVSNGHMSHQKCSRLHFVTASFDSIGVVRIASTRVCGETRISLCAKD